jgi:two-component system CheB/CheR fusion protein
VSLADGAEAALRLALGGGFDAIVSDIAMPGRDGYWLAARLRENEGTRGLALVAMSGMGRPADRARAATAGFDAHVGKPLEIDLLKAGILDAIARRRT